MRMTATDVSRNFPSVLSRVAAGEEIEVLRNGAPIAIIRPARHAFMSAERFAEVMRAAPPADEGFAEDLRAIRRSVGPPRDAWA